MRGPPRLPAVLAVLLGALAGAAPPGCSRQRGPQENAAAAHLRRIAGAYDMALLHHRRPPRTVEDLKPFLREGERGDPDAFLVSPNDGQPYEIVLGVNLDKEPDLAALLAHEKAGAGGRRYVITVGRIVKQMTEEEFRRAVYPGGKKPASGK